MDICVATRYSLDLTIITGKFLAEIPWILRWIEPKCVVETPLLTYLDINRGI